MNPGDEISQVLNPDRLVSSSFPPLWLRIRMGTKTGVTVVGRDWSECRRVFEQTLGLWTKQCIVVEWTRNASKNLTTAWSLGLRLWGRLTCSRKTCKVRRTTRTTQRCQSRWSALPHEKDWHQSNEPPAEKAPASHPQLCHNVRWWQGERMNRFLSRARLIEVGSCASNRPDRGYLPPRHARCEIKDQNQCNSGLTVHSTARAERVSMHENGYESTAVRGGCVWRPTDEDGGDFYEHLIPQAFSFSARCCQDEIHDSSRANIKTGEPSESRGNEVASSGLEGRDRAENIVHFVA
ncbi:hypothetical protein QBC37DRAFT_397543 [Rhypophila decipiens]|uniref:Uncharacterized protein n=1 Tax=Rhypophila decipiens TaxID=261697 RepID=A0AAN6YC28_9PEZI|nr:hypothetical protein QBC37DRAFT_397543 [Rhypophila decipiens]